VIQLRYIDEKSYAEIGQLMNRSEEAVHGLLKRAKQKLRDGLGRASAYLSSR
jgi:RNA polymerase sigma factor (sigma-70 family)